MGHKGHRRPSCPLSVAGTRHWCHSWSCCVDASSRGRLQAAAAFRRLLVSRAVELEVEASVVRVRALGPEQARGWRAEPALGFSLRLRRE